ncbi:hypothetical protein OVZ14_29740, partial [Salmonella enterica subsp. enterica serovar 1,4,[5],12:i:-]|nr:hypothetical protein [Salmonella enterica subsp. enterica serovar 1,4,[5],12:i:-]MCY4919055.1 hypothetical protein [Salmonella enterica subsp. enterica serovar 1,4,[5],12:i:-]
MAFRHSANRLAEMQRCGFFCRRIPETG